MQTRHHRGAAPEHFLTPYRNTRYEDRRTRVRK